MFNCTWSEYKNFITRDGMNGYIYRGQENSNWKLQTTFHREAETKNIDLPFYLNNIIPLIHQKIISEGFEVHNLNDIPNYNSCLSKLQHHGFPTPLLDWTYSPYIAAYFGILSKNKPESKYFSIYAFDYYKWIRNNYQPIDLLNTEPFVSTFVPYYNNNPRLISQKSILTVTNQNDIEEYLNYMSINQNSKYLYKINILRSEINTIQTDLNYMGIKENILFPKFDDICKMMKNNLFS